MAAMWLLTATRPFTRIRGRCITLDQASTFLSLYIICNYGGIASEKGIGGFHSYIGQEVSNLVSFPLYMGERDGSVTAKRLFNSLQPCFEPPASGDFPCLRSILEALGHVNEDLGVSFHDQGLKVEIPSESEPLLESL